MGNSFKRREEKRREEKRREEKRREEKRREERTLKFQRRFLCQIAPIKITVTNSGFSGHCVVLEKGLQNTV